MGRKNKLKLLDGNGFENARSISKLADKNPMWKGNSVGKLALHEWIISRLPKPEFCQNCKKAPPRDLANISQDYLRDLSDWEWLCRRCHMIKDGRMDNFKSRALNFQGLCPNCKSAFNFSSNRRNSKIFCSSKCWKIFNKDRLKRFAKEYEKDPKRVGYNKLRRFKAKLDNKGNQILKDLNEAVRQLKEAQDNNEL